jgi:4,5-dihydroxyphthalate decarboxylase
LNGTPEARRLFENYKDVEQAYFKKTKIFPIMHTVAMREELWKEQPWIAVSLLKAFQQAKEIAYERLVDSNAYKISLIWMRDRVAEQKAVVGDDPWAYGFEKNRHVLETIASYLHEQGLIDKPLNVETAFAPNTLNL